MPTRSTARRPRPIPIATSTRATFDRVVEFVATGGYALKTYERYRQDPAGRRTASGGSPIRHVAQQYRLNVGTIIEAPLPQRARRRGTAAIGFAGRGGRVLGKVEEGFIETLRRGDTFLFAGCILRFEGIRENEAIATRTADATPKIPIYAGGKFPLTTYPRRGRPRDARRREVDGRACRRRSPTG